MVPSLSLQQFTELIEVSKCGNSVVATLRRPKSLNALNADMIVSLSHYYEFWRNDNSIHSVILRGEGKAFCAGGDVRAIYAAGSKPEVISFFSQEYKLNYTIHHFPKPHIAFADGITMGGGAGISVNGSFTVTTERTVFAMPEVKIGFVPDVGSSYFLSRIDPALAKFLVMTGYSIHAHDVKKAGLATHYVHSKYLDLLQEALGELYQPSKSEYDETIRRFEEMSLREEGGDNSNLLHQHYSVIQHCFSKGTVSEILESLEKEKSPFANELFESMRQSSPLSIHIAHELIKRGRGSTMAECLQREYNAGMHCIIKTDNFNEGVRTKLIERHNNPKWDPKYLDQVTEEMVAEYFKHNNQFPPLDFDLISRANQSQL